MSFLRRRFGAAQNDDQVSSPDFSRDPTPDPDNERPGNLRVITAEKLHTLKQGAKTKHGKRTNFWIFVLGGLAGVMAAAFFAGSNDMIDLSSLEGVNLDSILDALPAGFLSEARELQVRRPC
jgi:phospholipid:diacylglycerol acyltransferase